MKVAVIGAGAMGSLYGGALAESGHDVYLIDIFEEHVNKINERGLCIIRGDEERIIKDITATTDAREVGPADLAIVFVKSTVTDIGVKSNLDAIGPDTIVLTLQNGLGNIEKIAQFVDKKNIIAGTSSNGATLIEPGTIKQSGAGGTTIGELNGETTDRIKHLAHILNIDSLGPATISNNVMGLIWDKLLVNVGINALTALTDLKNGQLLQYKESIKLLEDLVNEGIKVAAALEIKLTHSTPDYCKEVAKVTGGNVSSMLADVRNRRKTEIENINGAIVEYGRKLGIATPVNEILTNLILLREKSYLGD
ncbi:MAG TPA: 2-dehydropantoate 2-reductase [Firmicutes bacterium]|jgi:2-dehydropantoate 2-reductase|nr:2-dehydropantoate 2-reductase [Bacillota bacterium]